MIRIPPEPVTVPANCFVKVYYKDVKQLYKGRIVTFTGWSFMRVTSAKRIACVVNTQGKVMPIEPRIVYTGRFSDESGRTLSDFHAFVEERDCEFMDTPVIFKRPVVNSLDQGDGVVEELLVKK